MGAGPRTDACILVSVYGTDPCSYAKGSKLDIDISYGKDDHYNLTDAQKLCSRNTARSVIHDDIAASDFEELVDGPGWPIGSHSISLFGAPCNVSSSLAWTWHST